MEIGPQLWVHDKGGEINPRFAPGQTRVDVELLIGAMDFDARFGSTRAGSVHHGRARDRFCSWVGGRLVQGEESEQVSEILFIEPLHALGHHGEFAYASVLDVIAGHGFLAFTGHAQDDALRAVFGDETGEIAAIGGDDGDGLLARADDEAGIKDA